MKLLEALQLKKNEIISLVGAGGKTSLMYALGKEAREIGLKTILTTSTKIFYPEKIDFEAIVSSDPEELYERVYQAFSKDNLVLIGKEIEGQLYSFRKMIGLNPEQFGDLSRLGADLIVVESDGADRKPFKAPDVHEPAIPKQSTLVIPVVGIDCIGKPLTKEFVHRPEQIIRLTGAQLGTKISPEIVASVITSSLGYLKEVPEQARWVPFINKVETLEDLELARTIAYLVKQKQAVPVVLGAVTEDQPVREVIK